MNTVNVVALLIPADRRLLVERRKRDRAIDPGKIVILGGHVEAGETHEAACARELQEEVNMTCKHFHYVGSALHQSKETQDVHYYLCVDWHGVPQRHEAEELLWIDASQVALLDFKIDRDIAHQYFTRARSSSVFVLVFR